MKKVFSILLAASVGFSGLFITAVADDKDKIDTQSQIPNRCKPYPECLPVQLQQSENEEEIKTQVQYK